MELSKEAEGLSEKRKRAFKRIIAVIWTCIKPTKGRQRLGLKVFSLTAPSEISARFASTSVQFACFRQEPKNGFTRPGVMGNRGLMTYTNCDHAPNHSESCRTWLDSGAIATLVCQKYVISHYTTVKNSFAEMCEGHSIIAEEGIVKVQVGARRIDIEAKYAPKFAENVIEVSSITPFFRVAF